MSFWGIVGIVFLAVIILSMIFAFFHILFMLLPAILVIAGILWLINHFTKDDEDDNRPTYGSDFNEWNGPGNRNEKPRRKKVRNAHTKDVDK